MVPESGTGCLAFRIQGTAPYPLFSLIEEQRHAGELRPQASVGKLSYQ